MATQMVGGNYYRPDTIKYLNRIDKRFREERIYDQLNIKYNNLNENDIIIDVDNKKITVNKKVNIISFLSYLHLLWYSDKSLCHHRFPFRNNPIKIEKKHSWSVSGLRKIITIEEAQKLWNEKKRIK